MARIRKKCFRFTTPSIWLEHQLRNGGVGMAKCPFNKYKECQESDSRYCYCTLPCDVYNNYKNKLLT